MEDYNPYWESEGIPQGSTLLTYDNGASITLIFNAANVIILATLILSAR